jgi:hypothetical protein
MTSHLTPADKAMRDEAFRMLDENRAMILDIRERLARLDRALRCSECGRVDRDGDGVGWKGYLTDDEPPETLVFCPECSEREFGGDDA